MTVSRELGRVPQRRTEGQPGPKRAFGPLIRLSADVLVEIEDQIFGNDGVAGGEEA